MARLVRLPAGDSCLLPAASREFASLTFRSACPTPASPRRPEPRACVDQSAPASAARRLTSSLPFCHLVRPAPLAGRVVRPLGPITLPVVRSAAPKLGRHASRPAGVCPVPGPAVAPQRGVRHHLRNLAGKTPPRRWQGGRKDACGAKWGIAENTVVMPSFPPLCPTAFDLLFYPRSGWPEAILAVDGGGKWGTVERGGMRYPSKLSPLGVGR